ncbi:MAG: 50S ribosomal protein L11 methyltransferase [Acidobacteriota bacterium]|nr:50S ribosomal protein L11 methyltransferase [Acidobacteriota bacterium]
MTTYPALDLRFAPGPGAGTLQDMLYVELDPFEPVAIQEHEAGDGWRVFFRTAARRDAARGALASEFGNALLDLVSQDIDDEDWARRSQASLKAIRAGRIIVAPPWAVTGSRDSRFAIRDSRSNRDARTTNSDIKGSISNREPRTANRDIVIVIDPSTGFGTGHHATTRLCLRLLQQIEVRDRRVVDVGTGSGVLALAAWKLGASSVAAIDNDADALQNARENIDRNGATGRIDVLDVDLSSVSLPAADIVLANLTAAVLQRHADPIRRLAASSGVLIVSGFGSDELEGIARAFAATPRDVLVEGEWAAALFQNA